MWPGPGRFKDGTTVFHYYGVLHSSTWYSSVNETMACGYPDSGRPRGYRLHMWYCMHIGITDGPSQTGMRHSTSTRKTPPSTPQPDEKLQKNYESPCNQNKRRVPSAELLVVSTACASCTTLSRSKLVWSAPLTSSFLPTSTPHSFFAPHATDKSSRPNNATTFFIAPRILLASVLFEVYVQLCIAVTRVVTAVYPDG